MRGEQENLIRCLDAPAKSTRLQALKELSKQVNSGQIKLPAGGHDVNNHIHTVYSFSPYTPAAAVWQARQAGLATAGIMDHDTIAGAEEFIEAGQILEMPVTIGAECRASFAGTELADRRLNNPDQKGLAYIALHGVPRQKISALTEFLRPVREKRYRRNQLMTGRLNDILSPIGLELDFEHDIVDNSRWADGGEITERHILFALARALLRQFPDRGRLLCLLRTELALDLTARAEKQLLDPGNIYAEYDLLGALKSGLVEKFYIDAAAECPPVQEIARFCHDSGIILAYAYLGDITDSVTGDKRAQEFEDSYLDELCRVLKAQGFAAITYMPSRNSTGQLKRLKNLCEQYEFMQISGEDINQPRQKFICEVMRDSYFANLYTAAWALIGHEKLAVEDLDSGMFSAESLEKYPVLSERIEYFSAVGKMKWKQNG